MIPILLVAVVIAVAQGGANLSRLQVSRTLNQVNVGPQNSGSRIVGGELCNDCRWMASLNIRISAEVKKWCGGTIIKPKWIVSAASCLQTAKPADLKIRVGSPYRNLGGKLCKAKKIILHERYKLPSNDIALIWLHKKIIFSWRIKSLTLVKKPLDVGHVLYFSGWGLTTTPSKSTRNVDHICLSRDRYRYVMLKLVVCKSQLDIFENVICAYEQGKSGCYGDSGGPLYDATTHQLVGVLSCIEHINCTGYGLFADVFHLSDWIEDNINRNSGSTYRPLLVCWLVTLLHPLHSFYIRLC